MLLILAMSNQIALRKTFDGDDVVGHSSLKRWVSDDVRKASAVQPADDHCLPASNSKRLNNGVRLNQIGGKGVQSVPWRLSVPIVGAKNPRQQHFKIRYRVLTETVYHAL